jgi:hypothetical protein
MMPNCPAMEPPDYLSNHKGNMQWYEGDYLGTNERIRVCNMHHIAHSKAQAEAGVQAEAELLGGDDGADALLLPHIDPGQAAPWDDLQ